MASFTLDRPDIFPDTTSVSAYANETPNANGSGQGTAVDTQTMTSGTLTFTGLAEGETYLAAGDIGGGVYRNITFTVGEELDAGDAGEHGPASVIYVDANDGDDSNDGSSWGQAKATIAGALSAADEGSTLLLSGKFREEVVLSNLHGGVTIKGAGFRRPSYADAPWPSGASWLPPASPTAATPLLTVRSQGVTVENVLLDAPVDAAAIKLERNALSGNSEYDASHFTFRKSRIASGSIGIEDAGGCGFVLIDDCFFHGLTDGTGRAIYNSSTAVANPLHWEIRNSRFIDNDNHIDSPASKWFVHDNIFSAANVTSKIDFTGGVAGNIVTRNYLAGTYSNAGGYTAAGGADEWAGNSNSAGETGANPA